MADRGTAVAYDADEALLVDFQHVMEPTAAFIDTFLVAEADLEQPWTDVETYGHPFDGPSDFADQFTVDPNGTGWYMTEPVTGQAKLQGAPNASASVEGVLELELGLSGSSAGSAVVPNAPLPLWHEIEGVSSGIAALSAPALRNLVLLDGSVAGQGAVSTRKLGNLGAYRAAVLEDSPSILLHLSETSGTTAFNATELGGAATATYSGSYALGQTSLVESEAVGAFRTTSNFSPGGRITTSAAALPPPPVNFSYEFWVKTTRSDEGLLSVGVSTDSGSRFLYVATQPTGRVTVYLRTDQIAQSAIRVNDGAPHHVVVTFQKNGGDDLGVLSLYVDGVLNGQRATTGAVPAGGWGTYASGSEPMLLGMAPTTFDEWAMYDRALSPERIEAHYRAAWFDPKLTATSLGQASALATLGIAFDLTNDPTSYTPTRIPAASRGRSRVLTSGTLPELTFEGLALPAGTTYSKPPIIVSNSDDERGTGYALRQADTAASEVNYTDIPLHAPVAGTLEVRYFISSEGGYDFGRLLLDGVQFLSVSGEPGVWQSATTPISAGDHVLRVRYSKDDTADRGFDNIDIGQITYGPTGPDLVVGLAGGLMLAGAAHGQAAATAWIRAVSIEGSISLRPVRRAFS